jgi:hypothetical protein
MARTDPRSARRDSGESAHAFKRAGGTHDAPSHEIESTPPPSAARWRVLTFDELMYLTSERPKHEQN